MALPVYSDKPVVVSLAFARSSMRSVPGGSTHYREFSAEQHMLRRAHKRPRRYLFVLNEKFLPTGVSLACLIKRRKSVALQTGVEDNTGRVASAGSPGDPSQPGGLVDGVRRLVFSESFQKYRPSFRVSAQRSAKQQTFHERWLRLKDHALRLVEIRWRTGPHARTTFGPATRGLGSDTKECQSHELRDSGYEGPATAVLLARHMERNGGDPPQVPPHLAAGEAAGELRPRDERDEVARGSLRLGRWVGPA